LRANEESPKLSFCRDSFAAILVLDSTGGSAFGIVLMRRGNGGIAGGLRDCRLMNPESLPRFKEAT
jgi:hypothetical protein